MGTKTSVLWEDFLTAGAEWQRWEWVDGGVAFMTPVNFWHEIILGRLIAYLVKYCETHREWIWIPSNAVFTMSSGNWRSPDVSLVRSQRLAAGEIPPTKADFAPDVAFEILSPGNTPRYVQRKRKDYQESGVIQVWIDPEKRAVELILPNRPSQYLQENQSLVIENLPGFSLPLRDLFTA